MPQGLSQTCRKRRNGNSDNDTDDGKGDGDSDDSNGGDASSELRGYNSCRASEVKAKLSDLPTLLPDP